MFVSRSGIRYHTNRHCNGAYIKYPVNKYVALSKGYTASIRWGFSFYVPEEELKKVFDQNDLGLLLAVPYSGFDLKELKFDITIKFVLPIYYMMLARDWENTDSPEIRNLFSYQLSCH